MANDNIEKIMLASLEIPAAIGAIAGGTLYLKNEPPSFCPPDYHSPLEYVCQNANTIYAAVVGAGVGAGVAACGLAVVLGITYTLSHHKSENSMPKP